MPVRAREHIRRMRGGANAHLVLASDDYFYVVKFRNNPQHSRVLVNELIAYTLLDYLQLPAPPWDLVEVSDEFVEISPDRHNLYRVAPKRPRHFHRWAVGGFPNAASPKHLPFFRFRAII